MTMWNLARVGVCPRCRGRQTIDVVDAARPGKTFAEICPRCGGVGQIRAQLSDPPHGHALEPVDVNAPDDEIAFDVPEKKP